MAGKFKLIKTASGQFKFNLHASNGQVILSSETYETKASAQNGIESVMKNAADASRFSKETAKNGDPYFTLKAGNHQIIGTSEMYKSEAARDNGIASVQSNAPGAAVVDETA